MRTSFMDGLEYEFTTALQVIPGFVGEETSRGRAEDDRDGRTEEEQDRAATVAVRPLEGR